MGGITDWHTELAPYYDQASRMLGVVLQPSVTPADRIMAEVAGDLGVSASLARTPVGVFMGMPGKTVPDPYFGGVGPDRVHRAISATLGRLTRSTRNSAASWTRWFSPPDHRHRPKPDQAQHRVWGSAARAEHRVRCSARARSGTAKVPGSDRSWSGPFDP